MSPMDRALARVWLTLPFVRRSRRVGVSTRRMVLLYVLANWSAIVVIEAVIEVVRGA